MWIEEKGRIERAMYMENRTIWPKTVDRERGEKAG